MENNNPLSPHLQVYKWHVSSLVSIATRITGIVFGLPVYYLENIIIKLLIYFFNLS